MGNLKIPKIFTSIKSKIMKNHLFWRFFLSSNSKIIKVILPIWANAKGDNYQSEHANTPSRRASRLVCMRKTHVRPPQGTHGARCGRSKSVISRQSRRHTTTWRLEKWQILASQLSRFQDSQRSSGRSSHANHPGPSPSVQQKITPHIPWKNFGLPFSNFPPYFSKVADLRFNTF